MTMIICDHVFNFENGLKSKSLILKVVFTLEYHNTIIGEDQMGLRSDLPKMT